MAASALSCLLICSSSFANDTKPTGLYLKGFYDYSPSNHFTNPSMYGLGAGYKFGLFRAEGQYSYGQHFSTHKHSFNALGYLDLDNRTIFSPYIGLGLGYSDFTRRNINYINNLDFKLRGPSLVAAIGSRIYLNQNLALDLGYKTSWNSSKNQLSFTGNATLGATFHF